MRVLLLSLCVLALCALVTSVSIEASPRSGNRHKSRRASPATTAAPHRHKPKQDGPNNAFCGQQNIPYNDKTHKCCQHHSKVVRKHESCPPHAPAATQSNSQLNRRVNHLQHEVDALRAKEARHQADRRREEQERERREKTRREEARKMLAERERKEREKTEKKNKKKENQQKKKCGDQFYNPATERCCNCMPAKVVSLQASCPSASDSLSARCGGADGVMYDPSRHKCCDNPVAVVDKSSSCPQPPRQESARHLRNQMCGEERCCTQRWTCPERCGSRSYDPDYQGCCNGKAYSLENQFCCNGCVYNKGCGYGCCNGQLYRKGSFACCPLTLSVVIPGTCRNNQQPTASPTAAPSNGTSTANSTAPAGTPPPPPVSAVGSAPLLSPGEESGNQEVEGAELGAELSSELAELAGEQSEDIDME